MTFVNVLYKNFEICPDNDEYWWVIDEKWLYKIPYWVPGTYLITTAVFTTGYRIRHRTGRSFINLI
jgi:hypothetical protein